jgi:5-methylcytosine-specific restriction endonuclease McrA
MNKEQYQTQLKSDKWKKKREKILKRDFNQCKFCKSVDNLQVHHDIYIEGLKAWQVPDLFLVTLCAKCHKFEHSIRDINSFIVRKNSLRFKKLAKQYPYIKNEINKKTLSLAEKVVLKNRKKKQSYV